MKFASRYFEKSYLQMIFGETLKIRLYSQMSFTATFTINQFPSIRPLYLI